MQMLFVAAVLLTLLPCAAFVRGFWAVEDLRLDKTYDARANESTRDIVQVLTSHTMCSVFWFRVREHADPTYWVLAPTPLIGTRDVASGIPLRFLVRDDGPWWSRLGFRLVFERGSKPPPRGPWQQYGLSLAAPTWFLILLPASLTLLPARALHRDRRARRRRAAAQCVTCGYDLRGAAHERCPECGAVVAPRLAPV
jgi:hypothetical protein